MTKTDIINYRLINQHLHDRKYSSPEKLVQWMAAIQAQDYGASKWALGVRLPGTTDKEIEKAIDSGKIIRTHVLRPTWHLVSPKDVRWMMELSVPQIGRSMAAMNRQLGLDDHVFTKTNRIIEKILRGKNYLTREEIMVEISKEGINTEGLRSSHIMFRAELDMLVCNGPRKGKQFTYAFFDERVPAAKSVSREEALAKLALRYFDSRGPATVRDFAWWSGLSLTDARRGLDAVKSRLRKESVDNNEYWFSKKLTSNTAIEENVYFLPAYDEFTIAYEDRSLSLDPALAKKTILVNGIFKPVIVVNGKTEGIWSRELKNGKLVLKTTVMNRKIKLDKTIIRKKIDAYAEFLELNKL